MYYEFLNVYFLFVFFFIQLKDILPKILNIIWKDYINYVISLIYYYVPIMFTNILLYTNQAFEFLYHYSMILWSNIEQLFVINIDYLVYYFNNVSLLNLHFRILYTYFKFFIFQLKDNLPKIMNAIWEYNIIAFNYIFALLERVFNNNY